MFFSFYNGLGLGQPHQWQIYFAEPASPIMEGICYIHRLQMIMAIFVAIVVIGLVLYASIRFQASRNPNPSTITHNNVLEVVWTIIPVIILTLIGIPTLKLLFALDKPQDAQLTIKVTGHQWYWTYEYPQDDPNQTFHFDSYILLGTNKLRLLEVDKRMVVPTQTTVRILVTADDVLHSFAVPSLGIKKDAIPGRINETWFHIKNPGIYYGQCSELCGEKHGFMPIAIEAIPFSEYKKWVERIKPTTNKHNAKRS